MFLLGMAAIFQMVFLPGYLLLRAWKIEAGLLRTLVLAFGLSLVANHFLVIALVLIGAYQSNVVYGIFALELLLLWRITGRTAWPSLADVLTGVASWFNAAQNRLEECVENKRTLLRTAIASGAALVLLGYAALGLAQVGQTFTAGDAVVSWNRWAIEWSTGHFPHQTWEYPQLLPSNWSLTYLFIQNTGVWLFAKATIPLFCLFLLAAMFDLFRATKEIGYALGVVFTYWLLARTNSSWHLNHGWAEVPLAFFAFSAVYLLIVSRGIAAPAMRLRYILLGAILCSGAALTKQGGVYIALLYPVLFLIFERQKSDDTRGQLAALPAGGLTKLTLIIAALIVPWYTFKLYQISTGTSSSAVSYLLFDIHGERSLLGRLAYGCSMLRGSIRSHVIALLLPALCFSLRHRLQRWLVALVAVPYFLIWGFAFSYDMRNLALALPFIGMAAGIGVCEMSRTAEGWLSQRGGGILNWVPLPGRVKLTYLGIAALLLLLVLNHRLNENKLHEQQARMQKNVGDITINKVLYSYDSMYKIEGDILSNYSHLMYLPELGEKLKFYKLPQVEGFREYYEQPEVEYALIVKYPDSDPVVSYLKEVERSGRGQMVLERPQFCFFKKREIIDVADHPDSRVQSGTTASGVRGTSTANRQVRPDRRR